VLTTLKRQHKGTLKCSSFRSQLVDNKRLR